LVHVWSFPSGEHVVCVHAPYWHVGGGVLEATAQNIVRKRLFLPGLIVLTVMASPFTVLEVPMVMGEDVPLTPVPRFVTVNVPDDGESIVEMRYCCPLIVYDIA
jgi:hypothetical protein